MSFVSIIIATTLITMIANILATFLKLIAISFQKT
jgi:hypothetical protein